MSAYEKGKQPEQALEVFQALQQSFLMPDIFTCCAMISAFEKGKQPECALDVFQAMQQ